MGMQSIEQQSAPAPAPQFQGYEPSPTTSSAVSSGSSSTIRGVDPQAFTRAMNLGISMIQAGGPDSIDTAITEIGKTGMEQQQAYDSQQALITAYATQQAQATMAEAEMRAREAARRKTILSNAGINPDDINDKTRQAYDMINVTSAQMEPMGQEIDAKMAVGIFDNPLQWLINQTQLPGMVGQYNAVAEQQNRAIETAKSLQGLATTQLSISQAMDADEIMKLGTAKAAADASAAAAKAAEIRATAAASAGRDVANKQALTGQKFQTAVTIAQLSETLMKSGEYASAKEAEEAGYDIMVNQINKYQEMIGSTMRYNKQTLKMMPGAKREFLFERSGTPIIANSFSKAAMILAEEGNVNNIAQEGDVAMVEWFKQSKLVAADMAKQEIEKLQGMGKTLNQKELEAIHINALDGMQNVYRGQTRDMRTASDANPYKLQYDFVAKQFLNEPGRTTAPMPKNLVADYINQFGPRGEKAFTKVDEAAMLDNLTEKVKTGTLSSAQAAKQVADFYKFGSMVQSNSTKYALFGLEDQKGYVVKVPNRTGGLISSNTQLGDTVDLTNAPAVESYITRSVARKIATEPNAMRTYSSVPIPGQ